MGGNCVFSIPLTAALRRSAAHRSYLAQPGRSSGFDLGFASLAAEARLFGGCEGGGGGGWGRGSWRFFHDELLLGGFVILGFPGCVGWCCLARLVGGVGGV